jgi:uncharacterized RDD family membrane protein YckC
MSLGDVRETPRGPHETADDGRPSDAAAHGALAARAQAAATERAHGRAKPICPPPIYAGLVTRAIAFGVDAVIVNGTGVLVGVVVGLALSVLNTPGEVDKLLLGVGGFLFVVWTIGYFAAFWSTTGQTPGDRLMRIRVRQSDRDEPLGLRWALLRFCGLLLAAVPLLLGFLPILLNDRRRGLQDFLARSVVVHAPGN